MTNCPECGEKAAEIDVFCSYCGISFQPVVEVQEDVSTTETIVGSTAGLFNEKEVPVPISEEKQSAESLEKEMPPIPEVSQNAEIEAAEVKKDSEKSETTKTAENWSMNTESVDLPADFVEQKLSSNVPESSKMFDETPSELSSADDKIEFSEPETTEQESAENSNIVEEIPVPQVLKDLEAENDLMEAKSNVEPQEEMEMPVETEISAEQSVPEMPFENQVEEPQQFSVESDELLIEEDSEIKDADEPLMTGVQEEIKADALKSEEIAEVPLSEVAQKLDESSPEDDDVWNEEENESSESEVISSINEIPPSSSIEMPGEPLESENQEDQPMFDSVQIIQNKEVQEGSSEEKPSEGRSFTNSNIGTGDTDGRKSAKLQPLEEGTILNNRYEVVRKIGGGGMGAVYLANDRNLGGILRAVKEMVQSYIENEQHDKAISDFQREALILSNLDHPAIPTIYDYFFDEPEGRFYLVMRYISGGDLAGRLRSAPEGRIDEKTVTEWAIQIADVLDYLHKQDPVIVYRDLKPSNIMIDGNSGRVMLIDFGIARSINKEEKGVTAVGTMGYAPPELFSGNVDPRSDIYSLGSTMFHLLTGADPQSNPLLIFDFQKNPRPRQINSQLSDQIEQIVMRAVEYNSDMRFKSAGELCDALKDHLENLQAGKVSYGVNVAPSAVGFSEQPVFCGFCGKQIVASDVFCAFCGSQQPIAQQSFQHSHPAAFVAPAGTAKLYLVLTGELEPSSFSLEKTENLIGRRDPMSNIFPEVDLSKYDPQTKISRRHARIWRDGTNFMVEDLGSSNGTTLVSSLSEPFRLLPNTPRPLTNGDKLKVGDTTLHFTVG